MYEIRVWLATKTTVKDKSDELEFISLEYVVAANREFRSCLSESKKSMKK